eukprot:CAMPEP_0171120026 /NCGR_PEP_ID=MMETSP0766_2-20121228/98642_1 /TAXON_ID=439317 /ORGANISM="Gambierdiscus australes, Strain CAWD 149" /LENGTH=128 /DNA_ID=CAMNT_0011582723 /DNA_START=17 /DNA_END=400 /DNA_ORIENTATION=-
MIDGDSLDEIASENTRLKAELEELQSQREREKEEYEARVSKEKELSKNSSETLQQRTQELESMRNRMVRLTRQLDEEVTKRDQVQAEQQQLERKMHELTKGGSSLLPPVKNRTSKERQSDEEQSLREK